MCRDIIMSKDLPRVCIFYKCCLIALILVTSSLILSEWTQNTKDHLIVEHGLNAFYRVVHIPPHFMSGCLLVQCPNVSHNPHHHCSEKGFWLRQVWAEARE